MSKKKWAKLLLREKLLLISGISVILSIPLSLITSYCMVVTMTIFVVSVFYNLYKFAKIANLSITEAIETDTQKGLQKLSKISGIVKTIALPLAIAVGIPIVFILLLYMWISI